MHARIHPDQVTPEQIEGVMWCLSELQREAVLAHTKARTTKDTEMWSFLVEWLRAKVTIANGIQPYDAEAAFATTQTF